MNYKGKTNEELVRMVQDGEQEAFEQLLKNLRKVNYCEALGYKDRMPIYSLEDLMQEGDILVWEIILKGNFKGGNFESYFRKSIRNRLANIYRDYTRKNLVPAWEKPDEKGEGYNQTILVEADYAKRYREKHREECKRSYQKKKASQPPKEPKPKKTKEEKMKRQVEWQKEYYRTHPEKMEERRAKARAYEKARREKKKKEQE